MKALLRALPFVSIAVLLLYFCFPSPMTDPSAAERTLVEIWNVDTFEGGKGSRTAFLNSVSARADAQGVYFYVLSYTPEGVTEAFARGRRPDMISYGLGLGAVAELAFPLPYTDAGGEVGGRCLAVPWAAGGYFRFSLHEDLSAEGETAVSCGGANLAGVAAALSGISGEALPSQDAYVAFLNGEYRYLLGTQRDVCRFRARNVTVYSESLAAYNDLFQYISILSEEKREICLAFVRELLSDETQGRLSEIGMYPPRDIASCLTPSVFCSAEGLREIENAAREGDGKFLEKYLKSR